MRVEAYVDKDQKFSAGSWWAKTPEFVIETLRFQLESASAVWPALKAYSIQLGTGSESATGLAQCDASSPAREQSDEDPSAYLK